MDRVQGDQARAGAPQAGDGRVRGAGGAHGTAPEGVGRVGRRRRTATFRRLVSRPTSCLDQMDQTNLGTGHGPDGRGVRVHPAATERHLTGAMVWTNCAEGIRLEGSA
ncbi:hypothetical protein GCM10023347_03040 [Streptomyces chumphonensis]